jgi:hypothetical protein
MIMSTWEDLKRSLGTIADKTATKTRELTDAAALKIKIANKEADRDLEYKRLGKLTYAKLKASQGRDTSEIVAQISKSIENLDRIIAELKALKARDEERKAEKTAAKAADKNGEDTLNTESLTTQGTDADQ